MARLSFAVLVRVEEVSVLIIFRNGSHKKFRTALRTFIDENIRTEAAKFDEEDKESPELYKLISDFGFHYFRLGPGKHLHGKELPGGKG